ncbi:MAG: hypothetical protein NVS2B8_21190 [Vulcanimicrobiaceae bacterium]
MAYCLTCLPIVEPPQHLVPKILDHIKSMRQHFRSAVADHFARIASPLGNLHVAWRDTGITFVGIARDEDLESAAAFIEQRLSRPVRVCEPPQFVLDAVRAFFTTWRVDCGCIDVSQLKPFERAALYKAAEIPPGEVRSYGWIAREIGQPGAARAVGQVMAKNPVALFFPCHRVVDSNGALHNYAYGTDVKARILAMEGYVAAVVPRPSADAAHLVPGTRR